MGFFDFSDPVGDRLTAEAQDAQTQAAMRKAALANLLARQSAQSHIAGGPDPLSADPSIAWDRDASPNPSAQVQDASGNFKQYNLLGDTADSTKANTLNLLTADPNKLKLDPIYNDVGASLTQPLSITQADATQGADQATQARGVQAAFQPGNPETSPAAAAARQASYVAQADPDTALKTLQANTARDSFAKYVNGLGLGPDLTKAILVSGVAPKVGDALADNLKTTDATKQTNAMLTALNNAKPGTPEYDVAHAQYTQALQNLPAAQLAETIRHNKTEEANSAVSTITDPNTGSLAVFDKRTNKITPLFPDPFSPPAAQPNPGNAAPASPQLQPTGPVAQGPVFSANAAPGGNAPQGRPDALGVVGGVASPGANGPQPPAPMTAQTGPKPVYSDSFIQALPPEAQAKFAALAPGIQYQLGPILSGNTSPPEAGRAITDPATKQILRLASYVDPNFTEQSWRTRNKMATDMGDMSQGKLGGMKASAQKILNHSFDAIDAGGSLGNDSWLGQPGNAVDNALVQYAPPGAIGNSPAKKAALSGAEGYGQGVGDEFVKLMSGAQGAEKAKEQAQSLLSPNQDISSTVGGAAAVAEMMRGQVVPQLDAYNAANNTNLSLEDWLGPEATAKYKFITNLASNAKAGKAVDPKSVRDAVAAFKTSGMASKPLEVGGTTTIGNAKITRTQ